VKRAAKGGLRSGDFHFPDKPTPAIFIPKLIVHAGRGSCSEHCPLHWIITPRAYPHATFLPSTMMSSTFTQSFAATPLYSGKGSSFFCSTHLEFVNYASVLRRVGLVASDSFASTLSTLLNSVTPAESADVVMPKPQRVRSPGMSSPPPILLRASTLSTR
jgi:hypothetical protein